MFTNRLTKSIAATTLAAGTLGIAAMTAYCPQYLRALHS
jgi:hypothetical protein